MCLQEIVSTRRNPSRESFDNLKGVLSAQQRCQRALSEDSELRKVQQGVLGSHLFLYF